MSSKVMYGTYNYSISPARGDIGTATYDGVTTITPHAGVVTTYGSSPTLNIGPDPKPLYFKNGAGLNRAAVASIIWSSGVATCTWLIYDADADNASPYVWNSPILTQVNLTVNSTVITNPYKLQTRQVSAGVVDIYCIDYDHKIVFCVRSSGTNGDTYTLQAANYIFPAPTGNESFGVDLEIVGDTIYALFISGTNLSSGPPSANYLNSTVVKLNASLGSPVYKGPYNTTLTPGVGEIWPAKNAFSIQAYGTDLILVGVGGPQYNTDPITWNADSRIQKIAQSTLTVTNLLRAASGTGEPAADRFDFRALSFNSTGTTAFILTGAYDDTYTMHWQLYWTTMSTLTSAINVLLSSLVGATPPTAELVEADDSLPGYLWALLFSESTTKTWFSRGNDLAIYNTGGMVGSEAIIDDLSSLGDTASLNFITIYEGEVAPMLAGMKAYVAPAFASSTAEALLEREKFFKEVAAAKQSR